MSHATLRRLAAALLATALPVLAQGPAQAPAQSGEKKSVPTQPPAGAAERQELGELVKCTNEVSMWLRNPRLAEAIAKARSDKMSREEAQRNPALYLMKFGISVPQGTKVEFQPEPQGGGAANRLKGIEIKVSCCPLTVVITIRF